MYDFESDPQASTEYEVYCLDVSVTSIITIAADPEKRHLVLNELGNLAETAAKLNGLIAYLRNAEKVAA